MGFALIRKYKVSIRSPNGQRLEMEQSLNLPLQPGFLSKTFLRELVLATHYYFRLLERSVKAGQLTTVTKKTRIRRTGARNKKVVGQSTAMYNCLNDGVHCLLFRRLRGPDTASSRSGQHDSRRDGRSLA